MDDKNFKEQIIDGKVYEVRFNLVKTLQRMESGETVNITSEDFNFITLPQNMYAIKRSGKVKGKTFATTRDKEKGITYVTRF